MTQTMKHIESDFLIISSFTDPKTALTAEWFCSSVDPDEFPLVATIAYRLISSSRRGTGRPLECYKEPWWSSWDSEVE